MALKTTILFFWFAFNKLYNSNILNPNNGNPQSLQDKVQFDLWLYFICRANGNIDQFNKDTFTLEIDPASGFKFVHKQIDKQTKNYQDDTTFISGIMPEIPKSLRCPVKSYMFYKSKLHPRCPCLWQQCKKWIKLHMWIYGTSHSKLV